MPFLKIYLAIDSTTYVASFDHQLIQIVACWECLLQPVNFTGKTVPSAGQLTSSDQLIRVQNYEIYC